MNSIEGLVGQSIPSVTGQASYDGVKVVVGDRVELGSKSRAEKVVLPWADLMAVYQANPLARPSDVPAILGKSQYRKSSPLVAVLRAGGGA